MAAMRETEDSAVCRHPLGVGTLQTNDIDLNLKMKIMTLMLLLFNANIVLAGDSTCHLPIPDGGPDGYMQSKENVFGEVEKVEFPNVFIKNGQTHKLEKVSLSQINSIFSVYGGDGSKSDLKPGMQVWLWFKDCKVHIGETPEVAYFQFFSTDPKDRAKLDANGKIVSVPR
jgi:hypothetical protein